MDTTERETAQPAEVAASRAPQLSASFADHFPTLGTHWRADAAPAPNEVVVNNVLAEQLGIDVDWLHSDEGIAFLTGTNVPEGAMPIAMAYAGHQFGGYSPRLGDGRALLLGELTDAEGNLADLHLKGSGRTPYSRGGDGLATLAAMLREYLMAEAMHALSVPTSRALGVVTTGTDVQRESMEQGAVLARVAASHIRVGTFEYAARQGQDAVRELVDYSIERHYPEAGDSENPALALLVAVVDAQAALIARWMVLGFVHGVMNTDNVLISGETIDYGPCAFLEAHDPATVFSSIDRQGRYAYGNQPNLGGWDLARFAETLLPLISSDEQDAVAKATAVLESFLDRFRGRWLSEMAAKIGLPGRDGEDVVVELSENLIAMMSRTRADHTATFRGLSDVLRTGKFDGFALALDSEWEQWFERWTAALGDANTVDVAAAMDTVNPVYVPRNHLVEEALAAARAGNLAPFNELLAATTSPFEDVDGWQRYAEPAPAEFTDTYQTFCGT